MKVLGECIHTSRRPRTSRYEEDVNLILFFIREMYRSWKNRLNKFETYFCTLLQTEVPTSIIEVLSLGKRRFPLRTFSSVDPR